MNTHPFIIIITASLVLLWAYTALSKLFELPKFKQAMITQVFPVWIGKIFIYLVPIIELAIVALLLIPKTRLLGMYSSLFLMILFTLYVGGAVFNIYERRPCACGGIFAGLGWNKHFKVNIVLTLIALAGVLLMEL